MPYLVNTKRSRNAPGAAKLHNNQLIPSQQLRSPCFTSEKRIQLELVKTSNMLATNKYFSPDEFDFEFVISKLANIFDEVFFNFNSVGFYSRMLKVEHYCIEQVRQGKEIIKTPPEMWKVGFDLFWNVIYEALKSFLPEAKAQILKTVTDNVIITLSGLEICTFNLFQNSNLLEQFIKSFSFVRSDRLVQFYRSTFPDMETIEAFDIKRFDFMVSPYAKSLEDERFVSLVRENIKQLLVNDQHLGKMSKTITNFTIFFC